MSEKQFWIVDSCLVDFVGHHFEYDDAVAQEAQLRGFDVKVLSHRNVRAEIRAKLNCKPVFRDTIWHTQRAWSLLSPECGIWNANRRYLNDLRRGLKRSELNAASIVFAHMITSRQLLAWAWWCDRTPPEDCPQVVLLLRYQREFYDDPACRQAFRLLERAARCRPIRLATDSARLAGDYSLLTSLPFEVLSIPHTCRLSLADRPFQSSTEPLRVVSLGNARDEKGFFEIIRAVDLLRPELQAGRIEFVLQCNNPWPDELAVDIERWSKNVPPGVTLIRTPLDTQAYYNLLNSADIVALPYWRSIYASRTSGVFVEALAAGKPVVVSTETWMSDCLEHYGSGTTCSERDPRSFAEAIRRVANDFQRYSHKARIESTRWLYFHSPATLVDQLTLAEERIGRRAAVLYPWGNLIERDSGAAVRTGLLVDFAKTEFDEVRVFQINSTAPPPDDGVEWECYVPRRGDAIAKRLCQRIESLTPPLHTTARRILSLMKRRMARFSMSRLRSALFSRIGLKLRPRAQLRRIVRKLMMRTRIRRRVPPYVRRPVGMAFRFLIGLSLSCVSFLSALVGITTRYIANFPLFLFRRVPNFVYRKLKATAKRMLPQAIAKRNAARFMLVQHTRFRHDREFAFHMRRIAEWADVVFLDYTFWGSILAPYCRKYGAQLVISDLDVVADQSKDYPKIHRRTLAVELEALATCDHAVSVSASDRATFAKNGVPTTLIPNPIDIDSCRDRFDEQTLRSILYRLLGDDANRPICLFVGSLHTPNIEAVAKIAEMASSPEATGILFVIAGSCAPIGRQTNLVRVGRVDADDLAALYQGALIVLNPVLAGTGTAVKTLEAMACGRVLVATSVGMRGLAIQSGVQAVVCDDLAEYPKLLTELLRDTERRRRISEAARAFAANYDYRLVYRTYLELLNLSGRPATRPPKHIAA